MAEQPKGRFLTHPLKDKKPATPKAPEGTVTLGEGQFETIPSGAHTPLKPTSDKFKPTGVKPSDLTPAGQRGETTYDPPEQPEGEEGEGEDAGGGLQTPTEKAAENEVFVNEIITAFAEGGIENAMEANKRLINTKLQRNEAEASLQNKALDVAKTQMQNEQNAHQTRLRKRQERLNRAYKQTAEINQRIAERIAQGYDPQNFWADRSNFAKVMGVLAIAGGQFGAALTGTENNALEIIKEAVNNDIQAQKDHLSYLKEAGEMTQEQYNQLVDKEELSAQWDADEVRTKLATILAVNDRKVGQIQWLSDKKDKASELAIGLNTMSVQVGDEKLSQEDLNKLRKQQLEIKQLEQNIRHKHEAQALPAGTVSLPGIGEGEQITFMGSPDEKKKFTQALTEGRRGIREADATVHAIQSAEKFMKTHHAEGIGAMFGKPSEEWRKHIGGAANQAATMIRPVHDAIQDDPRMTEQDKLLAQELSGGIDLSGWWNLGTAQLTNKLTQVKNLMKKVAMLSATKIVDSAASRSKQGGRILRAWNNEHLRGKTGVYAEDLERSYGKLFRHFNVPRASFGKQGDIKSIRKRR